MDIEIRKMNMDDLNKIKDNLTSDFDNFWTYTILKEELENENSHFVVTTINNEIIGFSGLKVILDESDIMNIVVRKDYRKNGIGSKMLEHLINYSKSLNLKTITLEVNEHNLSAIKLYDKFNFNHIGIRKRYYEGKSDAIIMSKTI